MIEGNTNQYEDLIAPFRLDFWTNEGKHIIFIQSKDNPLGLIQSINELSCIVLKILIERFK